MACFAKLNIGAGKDFDWNRFSSDVQEAIKQGIADAWADFAELKKKADRGEVTSGEIFGTRKHLGNNYLFGMTAAVFGIWGNSEAEAMYPIYYVDETGENPWMAPTIMSFTLNRGNYPRSMPSGH
jgi:hypothetical protein